MSQQLINLMKILVLVLLPEQLPVKNIECKFVTIDIKTTTKKIRCPDSKQEVTTDESCIALCGNCVIMTCTKQCKVDDKVLCITATADQNNRKCQVSVTEDVLWKALKFSMKDKMNFLKQLMKNRFKAALNTRDNIISHLALQDCNQVEVGNNV